MQIAIVGPTLFCLVIGGRQQACGTFCRQPDGRWQIGRRA